MCVGGGEEESLRQSRKEFEVEEEGGNRASRSNLCIRASDQDSSTKIMKTLFLRVLKEEEVSKSQLRRKRRREKGKLYEKGALVLEILPPLAIFRFKII